MWKNGEHGMKCSDGKGGSQDVLCECSDRDKDRGMCYFVPNDKQKYTNMSSLLFRHDIKGVDMFCDKNTHNYEAPTYHNFRCDFQSAWEVILTSDLGLKDFCRNADDKLAEGIDFKCEHRLGLIDKPPDPMFKITYEGVERVCLLLDTSSSMLWNDRIGRIRQAALNYSLLKKSTSGTRTVYFLNNDFRYNLQFGYFGL